MRYCNGIHIGLLVFSIVAGTLGGVIVIFLLPGFSFLEGMGIVGFITYMYFKKYVKPEDKENSYKPKL